MYTPKCWDKKMNKVNIIRSTLKMSLMYPFCIQTRWTRWKKKVVTRWSKNTNDINYVEHRKGTNRTTRRRQIMQRWH